MNENENIQTHKISQLVNHTSNEHNPKIWGNSLFSIHS
jgi:hypothetical protein